MGETVADLKTKLDEMIACRTELAYQLAGPHHHEALDKLARIHSAIAAIEAVIASGANEPEPISPTISVW